MGSSGKLNLDHHHSKDSILDALALRLNCERGEVTFLFGQNKKTLTAKIMEISDVRFH